MSVTLPEPIETEWDDIEGFRHEKTNDELVRELVDKFNEILPVLERFENNQQGGGE